MTESFWIVLVFTIVQLINIFIMYTILNMISDIIVKDVAVKNTIEDLAEAAPVEKEPEPVKEKIEPVIKDFNLTQPIIYKTIYNNNVDTLYSRLIIPREERNYIDVIEIKQYLLKEIVKELNKNIDKYLDIELEENPDIDMEVDKVTDSKLDEVLSTSFLTEATEVE